jgi:hypothetical protein
MSAFTTFYQDKFSILHWRAILRSGWSPLILAFLLWIFSLHSFQLGQMKDWGLVSVFPPAYILALLVLIFGYSRLYLNLPNSDLLFFLYTLLLIMTIHATPQLVYTTLRYSWAWKHLGIIDYIQRHGMVDPQISILGVYHNWPGFFSLNALLSDLAGRKCKNYAGWAPSLKFFFDGH